MTRDQKSWLIENCWINNNRNKLKQKRLLFPCKGDHKQHRFQKHDFSFNVYKSLANPNLKERSPLMDQDVYQFFRNIEDFSIRSFGYHSN